MKVKIKFWNIQKLLKTGAVLVKWDCFVAMYNAGIFVDHSRHPDDIYLNNEPALRKYIKGMNTDHHHKGSKVYSVPEGMKPFIKAFVLSWKADQKIDKILK